MGVAFSDSNNGWMAGDNRIIIHTTNGGETFVSSEPQSSIPNRLELVQNYPNPFNGGTTIQFSLPHSGNTKLQVFDVFGRLVANPVDGRLSAGAHRVTLQLPESASSGSYYTVLTTNGERTTKQIVLTK